MADALLVAVADGLEDLLENKGCILLWEKLLLNYPFEKFTPRADPIFSEFKCNLCLLHDKVYVLWVLKEFKELDHIRMILILHTSRLEVLKKTSQCSLKILTRFCKILTSVRNLSKFLIFVLGIVLIALSCPVILCLPMWTTPYEPLPSFYH